MTAFDLIRLIEHRRDELDIPKRQLARGICANANSYYNWIQFKHEMPLTMAMAALHYLGLDVQVVLKEDGTDNDKS